jgi:glycogen debranching enzyme
VTDDWAYSDEPRVSGATDVTLVEGVTFCICDRSGDIRPGAEHGLFFRDTRFLSRFELDIDATSLDALTVQRLGPYAAAFVARRPPRAGRGDSTLLVVRHRYVGAGMLEEITIRNLGREVTGVTLTVTMEADFAGLFEVKEDRVRQRQPIERSATPNGVKLSYELAPERRAVTVSGTGEPTVSAMQLVWSAVVPPREEWTTSIQVVPAIDGVDVSPRYRAGRPVEASQPAAELAAWRQTSLRLSSADDTLDSLFERSVEDVGSLRISDPAAPERNVIAAGAPWFMTLFGRDSLLVSWMVLPLDPLLALGTLQTLARLQGTRDDPLSEEEPGRILHEVRAGLDAELALGGAHIYYGTADATPLFVMLLAEARRWGVPRADIEALLPHADRALEWIEQHGDRDGDGFVEYQRATDRGLLNQGWKDSFDGITFASGAVAEPPIALAEVQGYVYAAYLARSWLARDTGDDGTSRRWASKAAILKSKFNETFWLPERGYFALGLDAEKRPIDSLASNMGHCMWTGIVDEDKAPSVAERLMSREMFTGFGVRTLASSMAAYNPMSYHNGSVWPHDNAIIAAGLMRYGHEEEAQRIAEAIFDVARHFDARLPELFCGFDRSDFDEPVPYPTACYPQAWAAAAPFLLLRALLRLEVDLPSSLIECCPTIPGRYLPLRVERLHIAGAAVSCEVSEDRWELDGVPDDVTVVADTKLLSSRD